jgi:transposase
MTNFRLGTLAVARILGDGRRQRTRAFSELQSHYLFADRFGRPGKGNDKGKVEGLVGFARRPGSITLRIPTIAAIDSDRSQPSVPNEASRAFR